MESSVFSRIFLYSPNDFAKLLGLREIKEIINA